MRRPNTGAEGLEGRAQPVRVYSQEGPEANLERWLFVLGGRGSCTKEECCPSTKHLHLNSSMYRDGNTLVLRCCILFTG